MSFIKEEYELGLFQIALFGKCVKQLREHPEQEHGIDLRSLNKLCSIKNVDITLSLVVADKPVVQVEGRLTEGDVATLVFDWNKSTQNCTNRLRRNLSVRGSYSLLCSETYVSIARRSFMSMSSISDHLRCEIRYRVRLPVHW